MNLVRPASSTGQKREQLLPVGRSTMGEAQGQSVMIHRRINSVTADSTRIGVRGEIGIYTVGMVKSYSVVGEEEAARRAEFTVCGTATSGMSTRSTSGPRSPRRSR